MHSRTASKDESEAGRYVASLRDAVKRRFAGEYLQWMRGGRVGAQPARGNLGPALANAVVDNLDGLA